MEAHRCTRRQALQGAGAAVAGFAWLGPGAAVPAAPGSSMELGPDRAATMTALVAALALGPATGVDPEAYTSQFNVFYTASDAPFRQLAEGALDRLATLATMQPDAGLAALKAMAFDPARRLDVADGLMLAGLTFGREQRDGAGYFLVTG